MHNQMNLYHCLSYGINNISLFLSCFNSMANYIFSHLGYSLFTTWFTTMGFYSPNAPIILKNWEVFFSTNNLVLIGGEWRVHITYIIIITPRTDEVKMVLYFTKDISLRNFIECHIFVQIIVQLIIKSKILFW